jgi:hypothetical protein
MTEALKDDTGFAVLEASTPGRLDADSVREAALKGEIDLSTDPFLKCLLLDEWDALGWPSQQFRAANSLLRTCGSPRGASDRSCNPISPCGPLRTATA